MKKGTVLIDEALCKGCTYCIAACPSGVLRLSDTFNKAGYYPAEAAAPGKCSGCALCAEVCPEIAIEVYCEEGPKD